MARLSLPESGLVPHYIPPDEGDSEDHVDQHYEINKRLNGNSPLPSLLVNPSGSASPSKRQPVNLGSLIDASDLDGSADKVGHALTTTLAGDFTGTGGSNEDRAWGINAFLVTGLEPTDAAGLNTIVGALIEANCNQVGGTVPLLIGLQAECAIFGELAGVTVSRAESLRVSNPKQKEGATDGTIVDAVSLFVETCDEGTSSNFSLFVEGGISRFGGRVDITDVIANNGTGDTAIYSGFSTSDGGAILAQKNAQGGHVTAWVTASGASLRVYNGSTVPFSADKNGLVFIGNQSEPGTPSSGAYIYAKSGVLYGKGTDGVEHALW